MKLNVKPWKTYDISEPGRMQRLVAVYRDGNYTGKSDWLLVQHRREEQQWITPVLRGYPMPPAKVKAEVEALLEA